MLGEKEESDLSVSIRRRFDGDMGKLSLNDLKNLLVSEISNRRLTHS